MSRNILTLCRLCMKMCNQKELYKIYMEDTSLDSVIYFCLDIKVQLGDGLPDVICLDCLEKIRIFFSFKQTCLEIDIKFKEIIEDSDSKNFLENTSITILKDPETNNNNKTTDCSLNQNKKQFHFESSNKYNLSVCNKEIDKFTNTFQCDQCGRTFKLKTVLEKHMSVHTGIKPYVCKLCPKRFTRADNRMIHMRSHWGIKPYICEMCGRTSTKRQDLIRHLKIHSEERKYSCSICGRKFKRSFDVYSHMRTHTGLRPFKCHVCGKTYTSHSGLRKHLRNHCNKEPYEINCNS